MSIGNQQQLQRYARPERAALEINDLDAPFSFRAWSESYRGIIPGQEYSQYNQYLVNWYKTKAQTTTDKNIQIKINYLNLLKQLQLFFTSAEVESWYNGINLNNEKELLLAIPYFAKKLKDIALYYLNLRDNVKKSKIKYNLVGTDTGIILQLKEFLLTNYTKKPNTSIAIPANIWRSVPALSTIQDTVNIQIEELYDTFQYFDHSTTLPVSAYYEINSLALENYFNSLGLALTSTDWVYKTGVFELSGDTIIDSINLSEEIVNKYLGANKFTTLSVFSSAVKDLYNVSISQGNNSFYWPYGPYPSNVSGLPRYESQALSAAGIETLGTGGSSIDIADTIFIKTKNGIQGAWLRNKLYDESQPTMVATINGNNITRFRFPYPGYGLSGEDLNWTGFGFVTDSQFYFLTDTLKKQIENTYWSTSIALTSHTPISLNSTNLIDNKAYASLNYEFADKIRIWPTPPQYTSSAYNGIINEAWLYKMYRTDISIAPDSDTTIIWPYRSLSSQETYPVLPESINTCCSPIALSSIQFNYSTASDSITGADILYKIQNYQDNSETAIECAWLSGSTVYYSNNTNAIQQPALNCIFQPGTYTKFLWQGTDYTDCNNVFQSLEHQPDCKFVTTQNTTYEDHKLCTCRQVLFTPFGHTGNVFTDNASYSDFIVEDPITTSFDYSQWRGSDGLPATQSSNFAWFKTNNKTGWGYGSWITGANNSGLLLRTGKTYLYYRQNTRNQNIDDNLFPEYCIRYSYNNFDSDNFKWIQGTKNNDGTWSSTGSVSQFIIYPGNNLLYSRKPTTTFNVAVSTLTTQILNENRGSIWTNYDYLTINNLTTQTTPQQQFILSFPSTTQYINTTSAQYPSIGFGNKLVNIIQWSVTTPTSTTTFFRNVPSIIISPTEVGTYTFGVTAMSAANIPPPTTVTSTGTFYYTATGLYIFNNIPAVTAISDTSITYPTTSFETPIPGFVLNTPLYGWNYNNSSYSSNTTQGDYGAKPFWATTAVNKNSYTDFKGIEAFGGYIRLFDRYNFISQPEITDITLNTGNYIEYHRTANTDLIWEQPLSQQVTVNKNIWSTLNFVTTSISNLQTLLNNNNLDLITVPTTAASPMQLESIVDNEPVEIFYNALNSFTWPVTVIPTISETFYSEISTQQITDVARPWTNFSHRYYPNVAVLPTVQNLSSITDFGGFFVPQNLGASQYVDKDYTLNIIGSSTALSGIFENPYEYLGGRGGTKQDQSTPYEIVVENNIWLKEPIVAGPIAGTIKKNIFKKYQKFIPYQTQHQSNPRYRYGILNPSSRQTPWTGPTDTTWSDLQNYPVSFTGELNVDAWSESQILKQSGLQLDNWVTDVFGNQYGLYKDTKNIVPSERKNIPGEVWVRKNSQRVLPASQALSAVFDTYLNTTLYNELTGQGIKHLDVFFDTLYIETSGAIIFERLIYEYNTDNILSLADEARYIPLVSPVTNNVNKFNALSAISTVTAKAGETWFFPEQKEVVQSICDLSGNAISFELYRYNLNSLILRKVFPTKQEDILTINSLSSLNVQSVTSPLLTHNNFKKQYVASILCKNTNNQDLIIEFKINDFPDLSLDNITVYNSIPESTQTLPPIINQSLYITQSYLSALTIQLSAENGPVTYQGLSLPIWSNLSTTGLFTGTPPTSAIYSLPFIVSNNVGPTYYNLTLNAV